MGFAERLLGEEWREGRVDEDYKRGNLKWMRARRDPAAYNRYRNYGLSVEEYERLLREQGGVCAICRHPEKELGVDHVHKTGRVRALLCLNCNLAIGHLYEDPLRARALAAYLEHHLRQKLVS